jgi:probable addiction module antidote protein
VAAKKSPPQAAPEKFSRWDSADYLKTEEDIELYFELCLEEDPGDGSLVRRALGSIARARGMSQLARDTGLAREGLYKALSPEGNPEFATIMKVIKALGLKLGAQSAEKTKSAEITASADVVRFQENYGRV